MSLPFCFEQPESREILERLCSSNHIDVKLIEDICQTEMDYEGSGRPEGIYEDIQKCLDNFNQRSSKSKNSQSTK